MLERRTVAEAVAALVLLRQRATAFGMTRRGLIAGLIAFHLAYTIALLPTMIAGSAEGDLPLYRSWAASSLRGFGPVFTEPWVYPAGALLPILLPLFAGNGGYQALWLLMLTLLNVAALGVLTRWFRDRSAFPAAWWWLAFEFLLAPISMLRLEGVTAPLLLIALLLVAQRPRVAGALIAAATWIKVAPAAIAAAAVTASRHRWAIATGGLITSAIVAGGVILGGGGRNLFSFLAVQGDRSLQLEAPVATPWVWGAVLGLDDFDIYQDYELATRAVTGPGADEAAAAIDALMPVAFSIIALLLVAARIRLARSPLLAGSSAAEQQLLLLGGFALTGALIVFNKVGSPQYMLWLTPIVVVGIATAPGMWRGPARTMAAIAFLTTLVFPILYLPLIDAAAFPTLVLTARNVLVVGFFLWSCLELTRAAVRPSRLLTRSGGAPSTVPATAQTVPQSSIG